MSEAREAVARALCLTRGVTEDTEGILDQTWREADAAIAALQGLGWIDGRELLEDEALERAARVLTLLAEATRAREALEAELRAARGIES